MLSTVRPSAWLQGHFCAMLLDFPILGNLSTICTVRLQQTSRDGSHRGPGDLQSNVQKGQHCKQQTNLLRTVIKFMQPASCCAAELLKQQTQMSWRLNRNGKLLCSSSPMLQYAGNVIVFGHMSPCDGDWFGGVNEGNAANFLKSLVEMEVQMLSTNSCLSGSLCCTKAGQSQQSF